MPNNITFYTGESSIFNNAVKDENGIYFITDTQEIYKGEVRYGGQDCPIATSSSVGTVKPGNDFDIAADGTLTLYKAISISSFVNNVNNVEMGSTVSSVNLSWAVNKIPTELELTKGSEQIPVEVNDTSASLTSQSITQNTTFTLTAKDARNTTASRSTSINFLNGKYAGVSNISSPDSIDNDFIQSLTKTLTSSRTGTFTVNAGAGQYIYFAIPTRFGTPSFFVGGFEGGFDKVKTFNYTNPSGYSENYDVYKSTNANLGSTTVEVR